MVPPSHVDAESNSEPWTNPDPFTSVETGTNQQIESNNKPEHTPEIGSDEETITADSERVRSNSDDETTKIKTRSNDGSSEMQEKMKNMAQSANNKFHLQSMLASGPSKFFNPTNVHMQLRWRSHENQLGRSDSPGDPSHDLSVLWRSRDNRKGRKSTVVPRSAWVEPNRPSRHMARLSSTLKEIAKNILRMLTIFPYWDIAFWSGFSYSVGSLLFLIDGAWSWETVAFPDSKLIFSGQEKYAVGLGFFFGTFPFQIGATMAYFEAVNDGSFHGSAMRRLLEGRDQDQKEMLDEKVNRFFSHLRPHPRKSRDEESADALANNVDPWAGWKTKERRERPGSIYPGKKAPAPRRGGIDLGEAEEGETSKYLTWRWWPTWHALKTHHAYEIGYVACAIQLLGATMYGMCGIVALPGVLDSLEEPWQENVAYWIPQIVASCCFLAASVLFTLETQEKWYKPEIKVLGWWIGTWAIIGSCGFL